MPTPYNISSQEDILIIKTTGDLLSEQAVKQVLQAAQGRLEAGCQNVVVDMADVQFINSIGLNLLILLHKMLQPIHGGLVIAGASQKVRELLQITKLQKLFRMHRSVEEAVLALRN